MFCLLLLEMISLGTTIVCLLLFFFCFVLFMRIRSSPPSLIYFSYFLIIFIIWDRRQRMSISHKCQLNWHDLSWCMSSSWSSENIRIKEISCDIKLSTLILFYIFIIYFTILQKEKNYISYKNDEHNKG